MLARLLPLRKDDIGHGRQMPVGLAGNDIGIEQRRGDAKPTRLTHGRNRPQTARAHDDPGSAWPNWLTTVGHTRGAMLFRYVEAESFPLIQTRVVKLSELSP